MDTLKEAAKENDHARFIKTYRILNPETDPAVLHPDARLETLKESDFENMTSKFFIIS